MGHFNRAPSLNLADCIEHLTRRYRADVELPDCREHVRLEPPDDKRRIARRPGEHARFQPFASDMFECVYDRRGCTRNRPPLRCLSLCRRVEPERKLMLHHVAPASRREQGRCRVQPAGEQLLLSTKTIGEAPSFRSIRLNKEEEPATVSFLVRLRRGFECLDGDVREHGTAFPGARTGSNPAHAKLVGRSGIATNNLAKNGSSCKRTA